MSFIKEIVQHILEAQKIAKKHGYKNLLQPGLVKELIIGEILGHEVHKTKHSPYSRATVASTPPAAWWKPASSVAMK